MTLMGFILWKLKLLMINRPTPEQKMSQWKEVSEIISKWKK